MELRGVARKTVGICFVLATVFLWTLSSFMASFIFSDHTYDKPFFLVYASNIAFALSTIPMFARYLMRNGFKGLRNDLRILWTGHEQDATSVKAATMMASHDDDEMLVERLLDSDDARETAAAAAAEEGGNAGAPPTNRLARLRNTILLALELCVPWLLSDYLNSACLAYTSVASVTILTATSSIWTLLFGALARVESFSLHRSTSVLASLVGIVIISTIDLSDQGSDDARGSFPHKSASQVAVGDTMAIVSAAIYGITTTRLKQRVVGGKGAADMQLLLTLAGLFSIVLLWPFFLVLHWTGVESFELPPTGQVWSIIAFNSISSFLGDTFWGYSLMLISPLVVTVGLSMTIPLSLIGEMIQYGQYSSFMYWVGAGILVLSFICISVQEGVEDEKEDKAHDVEAMTELSETTPVIARP